MDAQEEGTGFPGPPGPAPYPNAWALRGPRPGPYPGLPPRRPHPRAAGRLATGLGLVLASKLLLALDALPIGTHLVVLRPLLGIAQDLVGFVDQLEAIGGLGILVDVGVVLASQASIGGLDLLFGCRPRDPEGLVVILVLRG